MPLSFVYNISSLNSSENRDFLAGLARKAKAGENGAFGEIYSLFFQKIYRFIFFRVGHKETAEDLAEEVFLKMYGKIAGLSEGNSLEAWLYQIARNQVIDHYRQRKTLVELDDLENTLEYESNIVDVLSLDYSHKLLLKNLKELDPQQQTVLKLKFFEDLDNAVIAAIMEKSEGAIRVIQHRAISKLKELMPKSDQ